MEQMRDFWRHSPPYASKDPNSAIWPLTSIRDNATQFWLTSLLLDEMEIETTLYCSSKISHFIPFVLQSLPNMTSFWDWSKRRESSNSKSSVEASIYLSICLSLYWQKFGCSVRWSTLKNLASLLELYGPLIFSRLFGR